MYKIIRDNKNKIIDIIDRQTGEVISPLFDSYKCPEDYKEAKVYSIEPMTAKESLNEIELEEMLTSTDYIAEEKLDGTRCTFHIYNKANRLFSRRISKKTDWYAENSDSVPHLRDLAIGHLFHNTVLDGEMRIDGLEFKDVSSTLNCKWDEAIARQQEIGFITFHAFDIIYYKGVYVAKCPLTKRKELLARVVNTINNKYVQEEPYFDDVRTVTITDRMVRDYMFNLMSESAYPNLYRNLANNINFDQEEFDRYDCIGADFEFSLDIDKKTFYEYVVYNGGEGIMLKSKTGKYFHKRGREYTKYKKFDTWDVVILDFIQPTEEYTGKELNTWKYWGMYRQGVLEEIIEGDEPTPYTRDHTVAPVTKHFAMEWIGTIKYGVVITDTELAKWKKDNPKEKPEIITLNDVTYLVVGECSGFDEETREYFTDNQKDFLGTVIEVGANEIMKTGKLRHPRYLRQRPDKNANQCVWKDHIRK